MIKTLSMLIAISLVWAAGPIPALAANMQNSGLRQAPRVVAVDKTIAAAPNAAHLAPLPTLSVGVSAAAPAVSAQQAVEAAAVPAAVEISSERSAFAALVSGVKAAVADAFSGSKVFDAAKSQPAQYTGPVAAMGLRPLSKPALPQGVDLDAAPTTPAASIKKLVGGKMSFNRTIDADPLSVQDVERALRATIDREIVVFENVKSADLQTVHVRRIAGKGNQADTIYAVFKQQRAGIVIDGSQISFMIKVIAGKPVIVDAESALFPNLSIITTSKYSDDELKQRAERKLNLPQSAGVEYSFLERKILFVGGAWRAVNLYAVDGSVDYNGLMTAVDVATGEAFAWDARHGLAAAPSNGVADVTMQGKGENKDTRPNGKPELVDLPLPHINVTIDGQKMTSNADGRVASNSTGELKAALSGKWAVVNDQQRKPVTITAQVKAGENIVTAEADAKDLQRLNQINMYVWISKIHDWWSERLDGEKRIDRQIPVNVNINQDCNAYYTPGRPSLNFFKESRRCSDTGRPGIGAHEYGHFVDDMLGGINNGGMSEGWGDIGSMFLLGTPIIGDGFLKGQNPSYIRHGDNNYQYRKYDEVHEQGQAWMGFAWKLRKAMIAKLGEAAGAAAAEALIVPTILAKAQDIPGQMAKVLLNATNKDGKLEHEAEIRAAAKAHGIELPGAKKRAQTLWERFTGLFTPKTYIRETPMGTTSRAVYIQADAEIIEKLKAEIPNAVNFRTGEYAKLSAHVMPSFGKYSGRPEMTILIDGDAASVEYGLKQIKRLAGVEEGK